MSNYKYYCCIALAAGLSMANVISAQTNTFPASGNVGIGTTNPATITEINKVFASGSTQNDYLRLSATQSGAWFSQTGLQFRWNDIGNSAAWNLASIQGAVDVWAHPSASGALVFNTKTLGSYTADPTEKMRITGAGNVGIGTASPDQLLDVAGNVNRAIAVNSRNANAGTGAYAGLHIGNNVTTNRGGIVVFSGGYAESGLYRQDGTYIYNNSETGGVSINAEAPSFVRFGTNNTERMRIDNVGNVGVGTTNPGATRLKIIGTAALLQVAGTNDKGLYIQDNTNEVDIVGLNAAASVYNNISFRTDGSLGQLYLKTGGNVGIGTTTPSEKLSVNGNIKTKKLIVTQTGWPDYVFHPAYKLKPLSELEQFIQKNKHLPEMPSASEVEKKGISVGDNQALLLKKIEELTLYIIQLKNNEQQLLKRMEKLEGKRSSKKE